MLEGFESAIRNNASKRTRRAPARDGNRITTARSAPVRTTGIEIGLSPSRRARRSRRGVGARVFSTLAYDRTYGSQVMPASRTRFAVC